MFVCMCVALVCCATAWKLNHKLDFDSSWPHGIDLSGSEVMQNCCNDTLVSF